MIHFNGEMAVKAWEEAGKLEASGENGALTLDSLHEYLWGYGCRDSGGLMPMEMHRMRVVVSAGGFDLGKHSFYLRFERRVQGDEWQSWMDGGAVYRKGEGWSVHTLRSETHRLGMPRRWVDFV